MAQLYSTDLGRIIPPFSPEQQRQPREQTATLANFSPLPASALSGRLTAATQRPHAAQPDGSLFKQGNCQQLHREEPNEALLRHHYAIRLAQRGVLLMLLLWLAAIGIGYIHHADSDERPTELVKLPLLWFDRQVLRRAGPFLPFIIVGLRMYSNLPACSMHGQPISWRKLAVFYGIITLLRWVVYLIHAAELLNWVNHIFPAAVAASDHMMSDHIFLTSSIAAIFLCESFFLLQAISHMREWSALFVPKSMQKQRTWTYATGVLCAVLYVLVVLDTYYSARHFHWRTHNNSAAVLGFMAFKLPSLYLLRGKWCFPYEVNLLRRKHVTG